MTEPLKSFGDTSNTKAMPKPATPVAPRTPEPEITINDPSDSVQVSYSFDTTTITIGSTEIEFNRKAKVTIE